MIELSPVVTADRIFGESMPDDVFDAYLIEVDSDGQPIFFPVSRCPITMIDSDSPGYNPGPLYDIMEASRSIAAGVPSSWVVQNPADTLIEGVVLLKSEIEKAQHFRVQNKEEW